MIALVEVKEGTDIDDLVTAGQKMVGDEPLILHGEVARGLALMADYTPHAAYSLVLDFASEAAWKEYIAGEPHLRFDAYASPHVARVTATQYVIDLP